MPAKGQLKTHCYMGHSLSGGNVRNRVKFVKHSRYVDRHCVACNRINALARYYKQKSKT